VTLIVLVLVGIAVLLGVAGYLARNDDGLHEEATDHRDLGLPDRQLRAEDIGTLRFRTGLRGYRMEDVDLALDQIAQSMRDARDPGPR
jgi:DivIVA domain-containing protein